MWLKLWPAGGVSCSALRWPLLFTPSASLSLMRHHYAQMAHSSSGRMHSDNFDRFGWHHIGAANLLMTGGTYIQIGQGLGIFQQLTLPTVAELFQLVGLIWSMLFRYVLPCYLSTLIGFLNLLQSPVYFIIFIRSCCLPFRLSYWKTTPLPLFILCGAQSFYGHI